MAWQVGVEVNGVLKVCAVVVVAEPVTVPELMLKSEVIGGFMLPTVSWPTVKGETVVEFHAVEERQPLLPAICRPWTL